MTLATASGTTSLRRVGLRREARIALGLDALMMAASLAACAALFSTGGLEAFIFMLGGAALGARNAGRGSRVQAAYSGGFAGLFVGAVFAAFFHNALAAGIEFIS